MDEYETITLFPGSLSDEAAFELSEFLNTLALACDEKYFVQLRRYVNEHAEQQCLSGPTVLGESTAENTNNDTDSREPF